jgi:hypothetical protein
MIKFTAFKFTKGEKVKVNKPDTPYNGFSCFITERNPRHNPNLYIVETVSGKSLAFYETELESLWEYDKRMGLHANIQEEA